jgi:hypothetical protein
VEDCFQGAQNGPEDGPGTSPKSMIPGVNQENNREDDFFEESGGRNPGVDDADYDPFQVSNKFTVCSFFIIYFMFIMFLFFYSGFLFFTLSLFPFCYSSHPFSQTPLPLTPFNYSPLSSPRMLTMT